MAGPCRNRGFPQSAFNLWLPTASVSSHTDPQTWMLSFMGVETHGTSSSPKPKKLLNVWQVLWVATASVSSRIGPYNVHMNVHFFLGVETHRTSSSPKPNKLPNIWQRLKKCTTLTEMKSTSTRTILGYMIVANWKAIYEFKRKFLWNTKFMMLRCNCQSATPDPSTHELRTKFATWRRDILK